MSTVIRALLWELWHRGWWRMLQAQVAVVGISSIVYASILRSGPLDPTAGRSLHFVLLWIFFVAIGGAALASQGDPARHYLLPLSHRMLAAISMVPSLCGIGSSYIITAMILNGLFGVNWPVWGPALFMSTALGAIQAATRLSGSGRLMQIATWAFIAVPFENWLRARYGGGGFLNPNALWTSVTIGEWLSMAGVLVVEYVVVTQGIARDRRGDGPLLETPVRRASEGIFERFRNPSLARRANVIDAPLRFRSAAAAQFWFEWRQKGLILPGTFAAYALFVVAAYAFGSFDNGNYELLHLCIGYGVGVWPIAAIVGLVMGHAELSPANAECGTFLGSRPMTNGALSAALLKSAAASVLLTWVVWLPCMLGTTLLLYTTQGAAPVFDLWTDHGMYSREFSAMGFWYAAFMLVTFLTTAWTPLTLALALVQTGRQRCIVGMMAASVLAFLTGLFLWCELMEGRGVVLGEVGRLALGGIAFVATVATFAIAHRRNLIAGPACGVALLCWLMFCAVAGGVRWQVGAWSPAALVLMAGVLTLPFAPIAAGPLALAWNRHR